MYMLRNIILFVYLLTSVDTFTINPSIYQKRVLKSTYDSTKENISVIIPLERKSRSRNIVSLNKCKIDWCFVLFNNHKGWISKNNLWGVEEKEIFKISFYQNVEDIYWRSINKIDSLQKDFKTWLGR